ncbi:hypothetical protein T08_6854 [Trichinella sp. T8]|nr:hypothetical protein T08_6854 [Trichinella sp. T8]
MRQQQQQQQQRWGKNILRTRMPVQKNKRLIGAELQRMSGTPFSIIIGRVDKRPSFAPAKPALVKWHRSRPGARA